MTPTELAAAAEHLRVFPLPGTVLLPEIQLPLQVFEPRYRAMVADAWDGDRLVAVPQIVEGKEGQQLGAPELYPLCAAGVITQHRLLPDGRALIVLGPLARVRLEGEQTVASPWRVFRATVLVDEEEPPEAAARVGRRLVDLLRPSLSDRAEPGPAEAWRTLLNLPDERVPAAVAAMVLRRGADRQAYLAEDSPTRRAELVESCLVSELAGARSRVVAEA